MIRAMPYISGFPIRLRLTSGLRSRWKTEFGRTANVVPLRLGVFAGQQDDGGPGGGQVQRMKEQQGESKEVRVRGDGREAREGGSSSG